MGTHHVPGVCGQFTYIRGSGRKGILCAGHCSGTVSLLAGLICVPTLRGRQCYCPTARMGNWHHTERKRQSRIQATQATLSHRPASLSLSSQDTPHGHKMSHCTSEKQGKSPDLKEPEVRFKSRAVRFQMQGCGPRRRGV